MLLPAVVTGMQDVPTMTWSQPWSMWQPWYPRWTTGPNAPATGQMHTSAKLTCAVMAESSGGGISCVTSRGSRLPLGRANQQYTYANAGKHLSAHDRWLCIAAAAWSQQQRLRQMLCADMVTVKDDDGAWLHFAGNWGTTPGPAHQGW